MKKVRLSVIILLFLLLSQIRCINLEGDESDYKYIVVTTKVNLEATINNRPAHGELIKFTLEDPDPGGETGTILTLNTDYLGNFSSSAVRNIYKGRRMLCRTCLAWYENSQDVTGNICDNEELDWDTAVKDASPQGNGTAAYTWNVSQFIDIKLKKEDSNESVTTWVYATIKVNYVTSGSNTTPAPGKTVRTKIYTDSGEVHDYTLVTSSSGSTSEQQVLFNLKKGDRIIVSAFLKDLSAVYDTKSLSYSEAEALAQEPEGGGQKIYIWKVTLTLNIKQ